MSLGVNLLSDQNFLINYLFGALIIVLYAKDKFNVPTYDRDAMGPFAQLPPQMLTIDSRYRQGLRTYIFLLLCLYTAICIVGPNTINTNLSDPGFQANSDQVWPVAAATFLITTGAIKDSVMLGRLEFFIRQYAHKTAYIPGTIRGLAYGLRTIDISPWLFKRDRTLNLDDYKKRRTDLIQFIGKDNLPKHPNEMGHAGVWARANIIFYALDQVFKGIHANEKMLQLVEKQENVEIFERLKKSRLELKQEFEKAFTPDANANEDRDKLLSDIQKLSRELSLMVVVLLSQSSRNPVDLRDNLESLGFHKTEVSDRSDHLVYVIATMISIFVGATCGFLVFLALTELPNTSFFKLNFFGRVDYFGAVIDYTAELLTIGTAILIYAISFKVVDYLRENRLDHTEWREDLRGYVMVVLPAGFVSALGCLILLVLFLAPFGLLSQIWVDVSGLAQQMLFQFCIASLSAGFTIAYLRSAVPDWSQSVAKLSKGQFSWGRLIFESLFHFKTTPDFLKLVHALSAAALVGIMSYFVSVHQRNLIVDGLKANIDYVRLSLKANAMDLESSIQWGPDKKWIHVPDNNSNNIPVKAPSGQGNQGIIAGQNDAKKLNDGSKKDSINDPTFTEIMDATFLDIYELVTNVPAKVDDVLKKQPPKTDVAAGNCNNPICKMSTALDYEVSALRDVCRDLNLIPLKIDPSQLNGNGGGPNGPPPTAANLPSDGAPSTRLVAHIFKVPDRCEVEYFQTSDQHIAAVQQFGTLISVLYRSMQNYNGLLGSPGRNGNIAFPMLTAFFIAYIFGAGCRLARTWWLRDDAGREETDNLREQIERYNGRKVDDEEFRNWLTIPLSFINNVAPREAVRYENLKARLFARIENKRNDQLKLLALLRSGKAREKPA